jgi:hypothetical protein
MLGTGFELGSGSCRCRRAIYLALTYLRPDHVKDKLTRRSHLRRFRVSHRGEIGQGHDAQEFSILGDDQPLDTPFAHHPHGGGMLFARPQDDRRPA